MRGGYARRKRWILRYHLQEFYIVAYVSHKSPGRVLEFGCGVGRHLSNLVNIPSVEVYGCDQSPTMLQGVPHVAPNMPPERLRLIEPLQRLPYPDNTFDLVFTAEVLEHVAPDDLDAVLFELLRVSKGEILHIEPPPEIALHATSHGGCWSHDLVEAYTRHGVHAERLSSPILEQVPVRVLHKGAKFDSAPIPDEALDVLRSTEALLTPLLESAEANGLLDRGGPVAELATLRKRLAIVAEQMGMLPIDLSASGDEKLLKAWRRQLDRLAEKSLRHDQLRAKYTCQKSELRKLRYYLRRRKGIKGLIRLGGEILYNRSGAPIRRSIAKFRARRHDYPSNSAAP